MKNEYLAEYKKAVAGEDLERIMQREKLVREYAWAVPNPAAIAALVKHGPIVELGAGTGYWAALVNASGGDHLAYDIEEINSWTSPTRYEAVFPGGAEVAATCPERALFLCWPPYSDPFAWEALRRYTGDKFIFVGEGEGGCTGDDQFFEELQSGWEEIESVSIPQWYGLHDYMTVYRRKQPK